MSMRKLCKKVNVCSKHAIETALGNAAGADKQSYAAKVGLKIEDFELKHNAFGKIEG